jgi:hypothetical protein
LIALDLDGTIVSMQLKVDPRDLEALDRARTAGWVVVACTGRPFPGALPWVRHLGMTDPFVCYQGAQIRGLDGSVLWDRGLAHDVAMEVIQFCRAGGHHVQAYRDDRLIVERDRPEAREYANHAGMEIDVVPDLDLAMGPTTPKLVIVAAKDEINQLLPEIRERWRDRLFASTSLPTFLEMTSPQADKRMALAFLSAHLGFSQDQVVAVGDGRNDRPMVEWAGLGVAIEGSPAELMEVADQVIPAPGSAGIALLVDQLIAGTTDSAS